MKTRIIQSILALVLTFMALPMIGQDYLKIYFKDGHTERHYMKLVQSISATKYDLEGNLHDDYQMQQIVMPDTTYSYYIDDIDSVSFRKVDEEQIAKDAENVASKVESIYEQCSNIKDIEQHLDYINSLEEVEYAYTSETDLVVQLRDSKKVFYHFIDANEEKIHKVNRRYVSKTSTQTTNRSFRVPTTNSNYKIAIAFQMVGDKTWEDEKELLLSLKEDLLSMGFSVTFFGDNEDDQLFDIAFYEKNMFDYDIVLLDTHGTYEKDKHWLMSAEKFESYVDALNAIHKMYESVTDIDDVVPRYHPIKQSEETKSYYFPLVSEDFFNRFVNSFKHSERATFPSQNFNPTIIFNGACQSLKGNDFINRNIDGEEKKYDISTSMSSIFLKRKNADLYLGYNESNYYCEDAYTSILKDMLNGYSLKQAYNNLDPYLKNEKHGKYDATLLQFPENKNYFLVKTHTKQISSEELLEELRHKKFVTIKGVTTIAHRTESGIKYGFKYGTDENLVDFTTVDATTIIDIDSPNGNVEFSSVLEPKPGQKVYYQAFTYDGLNYNYGNIKQFTVISDIPAEAIDLGLPSGTKWASYNVGATKSEEYGDYYSWGEIEVPKNNKYYFTTYSLCDGTVSSCHDIGENISGTKYDVAHMKWGGDWCMPTKDDFKELVYNCDYKETTLHGVKGMQFTGPNGNSIFMPYTGYYWNTENSDAGTEGCYWSATLTTSRNHAHEMNFSKDQMLWDCYINRFAGLTVRPVIRK